MSNPTELPDLDRENLQSWPERIWLQHGAAEIINYAERPRLEDGITWCEDNTDPLDIEYVRADLARRAKPEGEAPQAEHRVVIEEAAQVFESGAAHNRKAGRTVFAHAQQDRANRLRAALVAPAAQHAESGAQATPFRERFKEAYETLAVAAFASPFWDQSMEGLLATVDAELTKRAALAAQSQGAPDGFAERVTRYGAAFAAQPKGAKEMETDIADRLRRIVANHPGAHVKVSAKTLTDAAAECDRFYNGMMAWKQTAEKKDRDWQAERTARVDDRCAARAQQAAAPGALPDRFHWSKRGMELDPNGYYVAYSTPGTPEAPADMRAAADFIDKRAEQYLQDHADSEPGTGAIAFEFGEAGREYHSTLVELADDLRQASAPAVCAVPPPGWHCTRKAGHEGPCAAIQRAAQLDGGQGEGDANG